MTTTRLNPIEALVAQVCGLRDEDAVACGNWARLNASGTHRHPAAGVMITVDPRVLAAAARREPVFPRTIAA